jgi:23S rRNA (uridine2552-2'-O)-methyltransferase
MANMGSPTSLSKMWLRKRRLDPYYKRAKRENYRSRASYKLLQAVNKYCFIKEGDVVVDLGAAPGGWLQAARRVVGDRGFLLGVDLKPVPPLEESNVCTLIGDIEDPDVEREIERLLPSHADAVISDVSPNVSGVWEVDHARQIALAQKSLNLARSLLKIRGNVFVKAFQGDLFRNFVEEVEQRFVKMKIVKPKASRVRSAEVFVLGMGLRKRK